MKLKEFNSLAGDLFMNVLRPFGFKSAGPRVSVFFRQVQDDVYHFISPDMGRRGVWYDVRVFPHSPHIDPLFWDRFPNRISIPTDSWSLLSEHDGVNLTQQQFNCKSEENFRRRFAITVGPLLANVAMPYLDQFQSVADIIPAIRRPRFLGFALYSVGRTKEAIGALRNEKTRLMQMDPTDEEVAKLLIAVNRLLGPAA